MRVHPVIDWHYAEIWTVGPHRTISHNYSNYDFPVPNITLNHSLYEISKSLTVRCRIFSYTSLGGTTDTHPNPALIEDDDTGSNIKKFKPAYELVEDQAERLGRDR